MKIKIGGEVQKIVGVRGYQMGKLEKKH